jgi:hypothetical protein
VDGAHGGLPDGDGRAHPRDVATDERERCGFLRGVGANTLVCLGSWQALSTDDTLAKIFSMWWPAFTFTA